MMRRSKEVPAPGTYNDQQQWMKIKRNLACGTLFGKGLRKIVLDTSVTPKQTPGPGSYRAPSEFGTYNPDYGTESAPRLG